MENKDITNSNEPEKRHGNRCRIAKDSGVIPLFTTNTVTDATSRGKGNTPIPSEYAVREAKGFSEDLKL